MRVNQTKVFWGYNLDFTFSLISAVIGTGNVLNFPYLCFKNGGGIFLIPYTICLVFLGWPLFCLEILIGQFYGKNIVELFDFCPLARGVGISLIINSVLVSYTYSVRISDLLFYIIDDLFYKSPWLGCKNHWNTNACTPTSQSHLTNHANSSITEYYIRHVKHQYAEKEGLGKIHLHTFICYSFTWLSASACLLLGPKSVGKLSYFATLLPYCIMFSMMINIYMLKGSAQGAQLFLQPDFSKLNTLSLWTDAAKQTIYSLSLGMGTLTCFGSYIEFNKNRTVSMAFTVLLDIAASFFSGFIAFGIIGAIAYEVGMDVKKAVSYDMDFAFTIFPQALVIMKQSEALSVSFYIAMYIIGFGSLVATWEAYTNFEVTLFKNFGFVNSKIKELLVRMLTCIPVIILSIPLMLTNGHYIRDGVEKSQSYLLVIAGCLELVILGWVYGGAKIIQNIQFMYSYKLSRYWYICFMYIGPLLSLVIVISTFVNFVNAEAEYSHYLCFIAFQICILLSPTVILLYSTCYFLRKGGLVVIKEMMKPYRDCGPRLEVHRNGYALLDRKHEPGTVEFEETHLNYLTLAKIFEAKDQLETDASIETK